MDTKTARIRALNDELRQNFADGIAVMTPGIAALGAEAGCLSWPAQALPPPVGYICALNDPDGNVIEISHNQGVYDTVQEIWGAPTS